MDRPTNSNRRGRPRRPDASGHHIRLSDATWNYLCNDPKGPGHAIDQLVADRLFLQGLRQNDGTVLKGQR